MQIRDYSKVNVKVIREYVQSVRENRLAGAVFEATNGTGYVITSTAKGYGGTITVMSAFTPDGVIKQIKVTEAQETPGFGSNVTDTPSYWERYAGVDAGKQLVLDQDIDRHSGATISSKALIKAVNSAIEAYNAIP